MKIEIDYGQEEYTCKIQLDDTEKEISDAIESFGNAFLAAFFDVIDRLKEDRGFDITDEHAEKMLDVTIDFIQRIGKKCFSQYRDEKTEARLYGYMVDAFNDLYLDRSGLTEEEFIQRYKEATPENFTYETDVSENEIRFYMCSEKVRDLIHSEDLSTYKNLSEKDQVTRCMMITCILTVAGDKLFGEDDNPMRNIDTLHEKIADKIRQTLRCITHKKTQNTETPVKITEEKIFEEIREIIVEQLGVSATSVTHDALIADDLRADSLDAVELIMALEEAFELEIPERDAERFITVADIEKYLKAHLYTNYIE